MTAGVRRYNRPARDFSMIHHTFSRSTLPARAIKVGLFVLSHDHAYVLTQAAIASRIKMAVRTVADALRDLERARFLVQLEVRNERGHRTGTEMHVSDIPFTDDELAELHQPPSAESADAESASAKCAGPKKTTSKQETKTPEDQPSGGATVPAAPSGDVPSTPQPEERAEDPMPRPKPSDQTPALFDVERQPLPPAAFSAATVVGAYVTSYQALHEGVRPTKGTIGQVSRAAKSLIQQGATEAELLAAAVELGRTAFANLDRQVMMARKSTRGPSRVDPTGSPTWQGSDEAMAEQAARLLAEDPALAAWMAGDQAQVSA
jgi:hypothetical protein